MSDPRYWKWWSDKLAGVKVPASEGTPYAGFYRWVRKSGYGGTKWAIPIAYWPGEDGELHCREGKKDVPEARGRDIWVNVHNNPVPEDWYRAVAEGDDPEWADGMYVSPPPGDNQPVDEPIDFNYLKSEIEKYEGEAKTLLDGPPIQEQTEADKVSNLADELLGLWQLADKLRKAERQPHDEELKAIQAKWSPILLMAEVYKNLKYKLVTPWQIAQKKALEDEARAAEAAGEPLAADERTRRPRAGTRGRAQTLRTFKSAEITDFEACLHHFRNHESIKAVVQDLANKAVRVGLEVPGAKLLEEERTV